MKIEEIILGESHNFAISQKNEEKEFQIYVWGRNIEGQLGIGNNEKQNIPQLFQFDEKIRKIGCGYHHTILLTGKKYMSICF